MIYHVAKDNFDLDNMRFSSESTIEHDDSEYDHWELTMYLPQSLKREEIENLVRHIISNQKVVARLKAWRDLMDQKSLTNEGDMINKFLGQEVDKILYGDGNET